MNARRPQKAAPVSIKDDVLVHLAEPGRRQALIDGKLSTYCGKVVRDVVLGVPTAAPLGRRRPECYARVDVYGYPRDL
jgi:hypothetical protein